MKPDDSATRQAGDPDVWATQTLASARQVAPPEMTRRIMRALPARRERTNWAGLARFWPTEPRAWLIPACTGVALVLLAAGLGVIVPHPADEIRMTFELHAPDAHGVELLGSFNGWRRGELRLQGPDASGHWTATFGLPAGRHEYIFLVDGEEWVSDPKALMWRPDGFGHRNAVIEI